MQLRTPALFAAALGLAALAASAAPATSSAKENPTLHLRLEQGGDRLVIDDLGDLGAGESQDYTTSSGKPVTVTRETNGFTVDVDGRKVRLGGLDGKALAPGAKVDRVQRIEIGGDGTRQLVIGIGDDAGALSADAAETHSVVLGPELAPLPGAEVDALVAGLEKSPKFQALDDATQQLVRDIVREAAPPARRVHRIEVRRLPDGTDLSLERDEPHEQ